MAFTSARFKTSYKLKNAARDRPPLREGARGRAVHLLQFAMRDLGYAMTRSSRSRCYYAADSSGEFSGNGKQLEVAA